MSKNIKGLFILLSVLLTAFLFAGIGSAAETMPVIFFTEDDFIEIDPWEWEEEPEEEPEEEIERTGDIDGDGNITASDARIALRLSVDLTLCPDKLYYYADADGDRNVTSADARLLLRVSVGLDEKKSLSEYRYWSWGDDSDIHAKHLNELKLYENETYTQAIDILTLPGETVTWTSSVPSVASVSADGTVKALSRGYTCIYASAGSMRYCFDLHVYNDLQKKIFALQDKYPDGYYWNNFPKSKKYPAVTETPCPGHPDDLSTCIGQCAGFAALLSNEIFGKKAPRHYNVTTDTVKIGDYLRMKPHHSVFVIDIAPKGSPVAYDPYENKNIVAEETMITIAECNWGHCCDIGWGRVAPLTDEKLIFSECYSRY